MAVEVESVMDRPKARLRGHRGEVGIDDFFEVVVEPYVFDGAAADADEVVMVPEQWLGQLVVRVVCPSCDTTHQPGSLEHVEVAVHGTLRHGRI